MPQTFDELLLRHSIERLPAFDATWPREQIDWWFATFFTLLARCRDLQNSPSK